jgi:hypothetical protein
MERSVIRGYLASGQTPGLRFASSGLLVIPGRDAVASPESITTIVSMDSGSARKSAHPGMTTSEMGRDDEFTFP